MKNSFRVILFQIVALTALQAQEKEGVKTGKELVAPLVAFRDEHQWDENLHFLDQRRVKDDFVSRYSVEDIELILSEKDYYSSGVEYYFDRALYIRWGKLEGRKAVEKIRDMEINFEFTSRIEGREFRLNSQEYFEINMAAEYRNTIRGWASNHPKEAWLAIRDKTSFEKERVPFGIKSKIYEGYLYWLLSPVFERLAAADPDFAFNEIIKSDFSKLHKLEMLKGFYIGAPKGMNWEKQIGQIRGLDTQYYVKVINRMVKARWMQDSPRKALSESSNIFSGEAVGFWMTLAPRETFSWLIKYPGVWEKQLAHDIVSGIKERRDGDYPGSRFLRLEISRIEEQAIRELFALAFQHAIFTENYDKPLKEVNEKFLAQVRALNVGPDVEKKIIEAMRQRSL